ncbi:uncharacterized protein VTP21DRAFT_6070 [Calcarisporiella thermophila]|uniref:uncharacterized protein n=1 Tax=Calcarisporiella thermophila TaxID=911321 RepID=UPI003742726D
MQFARLRCYHSPLLRHKWIFRKYTTARAMVYSQYGQPKDVLKLLEYQLPMPKDDNIILRFLATPVNPADINQIEGVYPVKPPFTKEFAPDQAVAIAGNEGVAEVVATGNGVNDIKVGDLVVMARVAFGTWRTHALAKPQDVAVIPKDIGLIHAATLTVNPCTAYRMLKDFASLQKGDFIIQNGANSGVGQAVIQIARNWGIKTINIVRNRPDIENLKFRLRSLGATYVLLDEELGKRETKEKLREWTQGKSIKLGLNCVGGKNTTEMSRLLGVGGHLVTYGAMGRQPITIPASLFIFKDIHLHGFWVTRWGEANPQKRQAMLEDIITMIKSGELAEVENEQNKWNGDADSFIEAVNKAGVSFGGKKQIIVF